MNGTVKANSHHRNVLIVTGIFPPDSGGPATYVPAIATELVTRGHAVNVLTLSDRRDHDDRCYPFGVLRLARGTFKPLRVLLTVATILRSGWRADVLFVNGLFLEAVIANFFLRKRLVQKVVGDWAWERAVNRGWVNCTFEEFQRNKRCLKVEALKALRNFCVRQADEVIVPSAYLSRWVAGCGVRENAITVVYNAVETVSPVPSAVPLTTPTNIVTVGRLVPWKRIDGLISAILDCEDIGLVIVGDGPERDRLERLVRENSLGERVYFAGQRNKEETLSLMAGCDLFVLNSSYEGFPHVVLEAMSVGLPVVATAAGGTPELVRNGKNGVLVSTSANGSLSKVLVRLLSCSEQRQDLSRRAQQTAAEFTFSAMAEKTESVLRDCAASQINGKK